MLKENLIRQPFPALGAGCFSHGSDSRLMIILWVSLIEPPGEKALLAALTPPPTQSQAAALLSVSLQGGQSMVWVCYCRGMK